eukprot:TRINITY_DN4865_c0_g1_i1.p1 TRINITY_DN4865_c0_g1~~TRINITY_DN4865_c0_g1_i1.p1  ORF type:complete len:224 (-),score=26.71 TRINITY_DN4865_c0_g1_i1:133-804(-)
METRATLSLPDLINKRTRYVPVRLNPSLEHLSEPELVALHKLTEASKLMDELYLKQLGVLELYHELQSNAHEEVLRYFWLNRGPYSCLDDSEPFVEGVGTKPKGAHFYPNLPKEELESWMNTLGTSELEKAKSFFHVVRESSNGLINIPYSVEYEDILSVAHGLLMEAADALEGINASFVKYLRLRAEAFISNDYFDSDVAWLEIDNDSKLVLNFIVLYLIFI